MPRRPAGDKRNFYNLTKQFKLKKNLILILLMLRVALTGGIATGKTSLLEFFQSHSVSTIDADAIVEQLYSKPKVGEKILKLFHSLNRKEIAHQVFSSPKLKKELEYILHPLVLSEIQKKLLEFEKKGKTMVVVELPLLFEAGLEQLFDKVIVVTCSKKKQIKRLVELGLSEKQALARIESQLPLNAKVKKADFVIDNNESLASALKQAEKILSELRA